MNPALWAALGGVAVLLVALLGAGIAMVLAGRRARAREAAARADVETLRARVEELSDELAASRVASVGTAPADYVITTAGDLPRADLPQVSERAVLSLTVGEPLVKLAAFGYGVRRALSAESRNRIFFEMRREVKRARKARRRAARRTRAHATSNEETAA
jgi:outer membrane murein-binding lipoprotein Lpp